MANKTGKGGFGDNPQNINRDGANARDKSWRGAVSRLTNMTRDELIEYVGAKTKLARLLKELPPNIPIKDALVLIAIIQFGRDPSPAFLNALADREDGKPPSAVDVTSGGEKLEQPKVITDEQYTRAISTLIDAVREGLSGTGAKQDGTLGASE